jgi:putative N6-adenine-specific DNA methylase
MKKGTDFEIFLATAPGLEPVLLAEVLSRKFKGGKAVPGGVVTKGGWPEVWRANLEIRGATRILARVGAFRVVHLADLENRAGALPWRDVLRPDTAFRVETTCRTSRIYHSGAASERIERAIAARLGAPPSSDAEVTIAARIENDLCTLSVDTSGELLHKRGFKEAVAKAPMRETLAALFLRQCGFTGSEPVVDPMCGSGTFVIEAAEIASGLQPGRARSFAFEKLATFDAAAWERLRGPRSVGTPTVRFYGRDRDAGAIVASRANADRAGVAHVTEFEKQTVSDLAAPPGSPGLVIVNPPYGDRIGEKKRLAVLYRALGQALKTRFRDWRVGLVTSEAALARATALPFLPPGPPVPHGGLRVTLYRTDPLE